MRVAYPRGGPHVLVLFHSSWRKGHGILARTWEQAEKVFRSDKFQRHIGEECDLRVERALDIDIVSAPPSWRREIAAKVYREERVNFRNNLLLSVRDLPTLGSGVIHPEPRHPGDAATKSRHSATLGRWRKVAQHFSGEALTRTSRRREADRLEFVLLRASRGLAQTRHEFVDCFGLKFFE